MEIEEIIGICASNNENNEDDENNSNGCGCGCNRSVTNNIGASNQFVTRRYMMRRWNILK